MRLLREYLIESPLGRFRKTVRPDRPEWFDQQTSFFLPNAKVAIAMGGNRSGKTFTASMKTADLILWRQPPPWKNTPFVIVSDTLEQTCDICWAQNLEAIIPPDKIQSISWHDRAKNHPSRVTMKADWTERPGCNWVLEFHALKQGRRNLQGRKIGGCWFSEQFEWPIFDEVLRGCAHTWFDGAQFAEFTPIEPKLCAAVERRRKQAMKSGALPGWKFFRLNTEANKAHLDPGWFASWFSQMDPSVRDTRMTGAMPIFAGLVYPSFNPDVHVLDDDDWRRVTGKPFPGTADAAWTANTEGAGRYVLGNHDEMKTAFPLNIRHSRGADWGFTKENAFVVLWGFRDGTGRWFIYDEMYDPANSRTCDRIEEIKNRWPWYSSLPDIYGLTHCDASRPDLILEFNVADIPSVGATHRIESGVEAVKNLLSIERIGDQAGRSKLETQLYIYGPNCPHLIDEITQYQYIQGTENSKNPRPGKPVPNPWNDHCLDSLRYLIWGNRSHTTNDTAESLFVAGAHDRHGVHGARRRH
jgi:hypothetical protein